MMNVRCTTTSRSSIWPRPLPLTGRGWAEGRVLGELVAAGFSVPPGLVVTAEALDIAGGRSSEAAARRLEAQRFAVRSSAATEDLSDASYAGLYETQPERPS